MEDCQVNQQQPSDIAGAALQSDKKPVGHIEWKEDDSGIGTETTWYGLSSVFHPERAYLNLVYEIAAVAERDAYQVIHEKAKFIAKHQRGNSFDSMARMRPAIPKDRQYATLLQVLEKVPELVLRDVRRRTQTSNPDKFEASAEACDALFLGALGCSGRNYRRDCALCLTDEIMGTTCTCGHTEIAVFRPCGHAVCIEPCFKKLVAEIAPNLPPKTIIFEGQTFTIPGRADISNVHGFECPICRANVAKVFRAEDTQLDPDIKDLLQEYAAGLPDSIQDDQVASAGIMIAEQEKAAKATMPGEAELHICNMRNVY